MVSYDDITAKNYSLSAGQYFDVKIEYVDITPEQFARKCWGTGKIWSCCSGVTPAGKGDSEAVGGVELNGRFDEHTW